MNDSQRAGLASVAEQAIQGVIQGSLQALGSVIDPRASNREAVAEPPAARTSGPDAFLATGEWLRTAYSDLAWKTERHVVDGEVVVTYGLMSGRHTGNFVVWTEDGRVDRVFTPTQASFEVRQAHFQRIVNGMVVEHWAVRDDQGMAMQLGWVPPTPGYLIKCSRATKRARRQAAREATPKAG